MAFKGKSTIELRNAETGKLEFKTEDENMVTNAAYNILNSGNMVSKIPPYYDIAYPLKVQNPIIDSCFGGILLFEKNITEDVNQILPPADNTCIGHGNIYRESTSLLDIYRGVYNTVESKDLENGKRYVWDFSTEKANGTIRCVCLTSALGGTRGLKDNVRINNTGYAYSSMGIVTSPRYSFGLDYSSSGEFPPESYADISCSSGYTIINKTGKNKLLAVNCEIGKSGIAFEEILCEEIGFLKTNVKYTRTQKNIETTVMLNSKENLFITSEKIYSIYPHSSNKLDIAVFEINTLTLVEEKSLTIQDAKFYSNSSYLSAAYYKGFYYIKSNSFNVNSKEDGEGCYLDVYKINENDPSDYSIIKLINSMEPNVTYYRVDEGWFSKIGDLFFYAHPYRYAFSNPPNYRGLNTAFLINSDGTYNLVSGNRICQAIESQYIDPPYFMYRGDATRLLIAVFTSFLSTINNLSTPVVKNETQTMKVTYEITEI